jgi:hypothetical protein
MLPIFEPTDGEHGSWRVTIMVGKRGASMVVD